MIVMNTNKKVMKISPLALAVGAMCCSSITIAQIEEVIVTAQKREQSLSEVPISLAVAGGDKLMEQGIRNTSDLSRIVPGFTAQPSPYNVPVYNLRGVGFYESSLAASPTVAVYTDEVPLPFSAMTRVSPLDVQRVEVLKGPQGTLFGNNTTGGAINYVINKPTEEFEAGIDLSYERFYKSDIQGFISGALTEDVNARLSFRTSQGGAWQRSRTRSGDELGDDDIWQGRLLVDWYATENLKFAFNFNGWRDRSDTQAAQLDKIVIAVPGDSPKIPRLEAQIPARKSARDADWTPNSGLGPHRNDTEFKQASVRADYQINDSLQFTSITAYQEYDTNANQEFDGTPLKISDVRSSGYLKTFSQEFRINGVTETLNYVVGLNYQKDRTYDELEYEFGDATASTVGPEEITRTGSYNDQDIETYAAYGNIEWQITDSLGIFAGVRHTENKRDFEGCSLDLTAPGTTHFAFNFLQSVMRTDGLYEPLSPNQCWTFKPGFVPYGDDRVREKLDEKNTSWRVGANFNLPTDGIVYASVSKGYKSGSFPTTQATQDIQYVPVKQESLLAYEVGFKQPLFDRRMQFNGAAFFYDYKGKQVRGRVVDIAFGPLDALVQLPKSEVFGIELEMVAQPFTNYTLSLAGVYLDTEVEKFVGYNSAGILEDYAGTEFPYSPDLQISFDNQYDFSINENLEGFIGASATYKSKTNASLGEPRDYVIPSYTLVDLRAGIRSVDDRWTVQVWGRNVTDKYYWTNVVLFDDARVRYAGRPATYGVSLSMRF